MAAIPNKINSSNIKIDTQHPKHHQIYLCHIKQNINKLNFLLKVGEGDVAKLAFLVFLPPFSDFLPKQTQLSALFLDNNNQLRVNNTLQANTLEFAHFLSSPHTSSTL